LTSVLTIADGGPCLPTAASVESMLSKTLVNYFMVRGDRRVTGCDMIRIMGWDQLIEYLGDLWEEMWDATLFKLKAAEASTP